MATLSETGIPFNDFEEEIILLRRRILKDMVETDGLKVWVKTKKQLLPNAQYEFAIEEVEDANGKLVGVQLLIS